MHWIKKKGKGNKEGGITMYGTEILGMISPHWADGQHCMAFFRTQQSVGLNSYGIHPSPDLSPETGVVNTPVSCPLFLQWINPGLSCEYLNERGNRNVLEVAETHIRCKDGPACLDPLGNIQKYDHILRLLARFLWALEPALC